jgi:hypothetical protein
VLITVAAVVLIRLWVRVFSGARRTFEVGS